MIIILSLFLGLFCQEVNSCPPNLVIKGEISRQQLAELFFQLTDKPVSEDSFFFWYARLDDLTVIKSHGEMNSDIMMCEVALACIETMLKANFYPLKKNVRCETREIVSLRINEETYRFNIVKIDISDLSQLKKSILMYYKNQVPK